ncbi:MAG TPA: lytic transglycosylase domain-containing protein [Longilinea sp.]|nr:lytic transglycosylase domain-containing protein [Longilinea sp.]
MNSIQRAIFPAILISSFVLVGITRLITIPQITVLAATEPPLQSESSIPNTGEAVPAEAATNNSSEASRGEGISNGIASECSLSEKFPDAIRQWCGWIEQYAVEVGLEPKLIASVMLQESGGKADAYSHSGAVGLMQVMPRDGLAADFLCSGKPCFSSRPTMDELFDPEYNISYGTRMLAALVSRHGSVRDALYAYGPMDIGYRYADLVLSIYENY